MRAVQQTAVLQRMSQGEVRRTHSGQRRLHTRPNGLAERIRCQPALWLPRDRPEALSRAACAFTC